MRVDWHFEAFRQYFVVDLNLVRSPRSPARAVFGLVNEIHALRDPTRSARPISLGEIRLNYRCIDSIIQRCTRVELTVKPVAPFRSDVRQIMHSRRELLAWAIHLDFHDSIYASFSAAEQVSLRSRRAVSFWTCFYCTICVSWFRWTSKRRETRFGQFRCPITLAVNWTFTNWTALGARQFGFHARLRLFFSKTP